MTLQAPFPYFGGKSRIAETVWQAFGDVDNYVEPFGGSLAVLLARPDAHQWWKRTETVNDADGFISNFWRAIRDAPEAVARHADWPVNENDLHARHLWLIGQRRSLSARLEADPDFYDARVAGWWVWGICAWIGSGWCSAQGPWTAVDGEFIDSGGGINRQLVHLGNGQGINRKLVHLGDDGRGINRQLVHLGDDGQGINRKLVHLGNDGRGINRKRVHLSNDGQGNAAVWSLHLEQMMCDLSDRLRRVRVASGDWRRVCGPSPTVKLGVTGVFLDPPYGLDAKRASDLYRVDSVDVAGDAREWAIAHGDDPDLRIALCGYEGEHDMPDGWRVSIWSAKGGYAGQRKDGTVNPNAHLERVWFSPSCTPDVEQLRLSWAT